MFGLDIKELESYKLGEKEGLQKGIKEGLQKGRIAGLITAIYKILLKKFPDQSEEIAEIRNKLENITEEALLLKILEKSYDAKELKEIKHFWV